MSQRRLFYIGENEELKPEFDMGKDVRDETYRNLDQLYINNGQMKVYETLLNHLDGLTDSEIARITKLRRSTVNARRNELMHMGLVIASHKEEYLINGRKTLNTVWRAL